MGDGNVYQSSSLYFLFFFTFWIHKLADAMLDRSFVPLLVFLALFNCKRQSSFKSFYPPLPSPPFSRSYSPPPKKANKWKNVSEDLRCAFTTPLTNRFHKLAANNKIYAILYTQKRFSDAISLKIRLFTILSIVKCLKFLRQIPSK